ncbi:hypothetical protein H1V43_32250 [Streptomyces sp. PSKA54]|uniref:Uncharacterized protein n=1 Tax=Streptomyces himalayensis subsp. aureolus TaxID=2758039 RepID=A0A7W2HJB3_9ACTN|nr:hypothetical protein [Streptomyces himalayensis]MBA4865937.1 hypothetical protein [Streptomyces himalayensis subsp. aureolus]
MTTPPAVGKTITVKVNQELYDDLAVMLRTGMTVTDAVRRAVFHMAEAYHNAWTTGAIPDGKQPIVNACVISGYDDDGTPMPLRPTGDATPRPTAVPPSAAQAAPRPTPVRRSAS